MRRLMTLVKLALYARVHSRMQTTVIQPSKYRHFIRREVAVFKYTNPDLKGKVHLICTALLVFQAFLKSKLIFCFFSTRSLQKYVLFTGDMSCGHAVSILFVFEAFKANFRGG